MAQACPEALKWFALIVKPLHEKVVAARLCAKSFESYVPLYRERHRWSDRIQILEKALFPRYVFCRFDGVQRATILSTPSVQSIVGFGGAGAPVPDEEIGNLRIMIGSGLPVAPWRYVTVGQRVRICDGPMAGVEGILARQKSGDRIVVNIELLKCAAAVEISSDSIEPVRI